jgi:SAM-dependent methyltransferase
VVDNYDLEYHNQMAQVAGRSAEIIVRMLVDLLRPSSVIDIGCGVGRWLVEFEKMGVVDILGVDGHYIDNGSLMIASEKFLPADLREPFTLGRTFDLVVSLEVAEHLPEDSARTFVESLTRLGDAIVFSAAVPAQGGVSHVNEQWPSYWSCLFREQGFDPLDCIRPRIWSEAGVEWWYAQNVLLYMRQGSKILPRLARMPVFPTDKGNPISLVHPALYSSRIQFYEADIARIIAQKLRRLLPERMRQSLGHMARGLFSG